MGIPETVVSGFSIVSVDSPSTSSAQTYTFAIRRTDADTARVNADATLTAIEVAA